MGEVTTAQIKATVHDALKEFGISISRVVSFKKRMTTKEVSEYLERDRKWVYRNKVALGGKRKNLRNDYDFDTSKVVDYKLKELIQ